MAGTGATLGLQMFVQRKFKYPFQWNVLVAVGGYSRVGPRAPETYSSCQRWRWLFSRDEFPLGVGEGGLRSRHPCILGWGPSSR